MNPNTRWCASALWLAFVFSATAFVTTSAWSDQNQGEPLPNDPLGITPYVSTFSVKSSDPLDAYNTRPSRSDGAFGAIRLDNEAPIEFFHGQDAPSTKRTIDLDQFDTNAPQTGVDVNLTGFLRHRIDADLAEKKADIDKKIERNKEIDGMLTRYYAQDSGLSDRQVEALNKEHVANERAIKTMRVDTIRAERVIKDKGDLIDKEIAESAKVIRAALFTVLRRCVWEGGRDAKQVQLGKSVGTMTTCSNGPAMGTIDALADVVDRDKALKDKGPPFTSLAPGALLNIGANADEDIYHGNGGFLMHLFGIQAFACRATDEATTCEVATDNHDHNPARDIAAHEQAAARDAKTAAVDDEGTTKSVAASEDAAPSDPKSDTGSAARSVDGSGN